MLLHVSGWLQSFRTSCDCPPLGAVMDTMYFTIHQWTWQLRQRIPQSFWSLKLKTHWSITMPVRFWKMWSGLWTQVLGSQTGNFANWNLKTVEPDWSVHVCNSRGLTWGIPRITDMKNLKRLAADPCLVDCWKGWSGLSVGQARIWDSRRKFQL